MDFRARTADDMITGMAPVLTDGVFVFATLSPAELTQDLAAKGIGSFREAEGLSLLLPVEVAHVHGFPIDQPMRCITLNVYSDLEGVGLTAAVATVLAEHGIACNMIAAFHHDHAFVPAAEGERALDLLLALQNAR